MRRFLAFIFLCTLPLLAETPAGAFLGLHGGQEHRYGVDLGFTTSSVGASAWGAHLGFITMMEHGSDDPNSTAYTAKAPGSYKATVNIQGYQLGAFADLGRAWIALGAEHQAITTRNYTVLPDRTWVVNPETKEQGLGGYIKAGYKFSSISIYVGYGSRTHLVAGVGLHF